MKTVYKYQVEFSKLDSDSSLNLMLPSGAKVLSAIEQNGNIVIYVLLKTETFVVIGPRRFWIIGTGHPAQDVMGKNFIGTVKLLDGGLVFHVFSEVF
jgi:hypothetical protein